MGDFDIFLTEVVCYKAVFSVVTQRSSPQKLHDWQLTETFSVVLSRMQRPMNCILRKTKHERFMVIF